jgi:hypothetical protein
MRAGGRGNDAATNAAQHQEATMATVHRARAVLRIKKRKTVSVVGRANAMCNAIDNNAPLFPAPNPPTSTIRDQVAVVNKAESLANTRAKGAAGARDVQRNALVAMLESETTYIQSVADKSPTWDQAVATINNGGLEVAALGGKKKDSLEVKVGTRAGSVILDANVASLTAGLKGKFFFNWQSTIDGKTFVNVPSTPNHLATVEDLTPLTTYGFRVSVTDNAGVMGPWSQIVYYLVTR